MTFTVYGFVFEVYCSLYRVFTIAMVIIIGAPVSSQLHTVDPH